MSDNANSVKEGSSRLSKSLDDPLSKRDPNKKEWVKFEEDDSKATFSFNNVSLDNDEVRTMLSHMIAFMQYGIITYT